MNFFLDFSNIFNNDYLQIEILGILLGLALYPYVYTASMMIMEIAGKLLVKIFLERLIEMNLKFTVES